MKTKWQLAFFMTGLFVLSSAHAASMGNGRPRPMLTLESVEGMNSFARNYAIVDLLMGGQSSPDRDQILQRYLHQASREAQAQIYEVGFDIAFASRKRDYAQDFFEKGTRLSSEFSKGAICKAFNHLVSGSDYDQTRNLQSLSRNQNMVESLIPMIQSNPNASNYLCQIGSESPQNFTVKDLVAAASPSLGERLNPHYRPPVSAKPINQPLTPLQLKDSACSPAQSKRILSERLLEVRQKGEAAFALRDGNCLVNGIMKKAKIGSTYTYTMIKNPKTGAERVLNFRDLSELVTLFQATEKPVQAKTVAVEKPNPPPPAEDPNATAGGAWANPLSNSSIRYSQ